MPAIVGYPVDVGLLHDEKVPVVARDDSMPPSPVSKGWKRGIVAYDRLPRYLRAASCRPEA